VLSDAKKEKIWVQSCKRSQQQIDSLTTNYSREKKGPTKRWSHLSLTDVEVQNRAKGKGLTVEELTKEIEKISVEVIEIARKHSFALQRRPLKKKPNKTELLDLLAELRLDEFQLTMWSKQTLGLDGEKEERDDDDLVSPPTLRHFAPELCRVN
jgi:hypothetical protein